MAAIDAGVGKVVLVLDAPPHDLHVSPAMPFLGSPTASRASLDDP